MRRIEISAPLRSELAETLHLAVPLALANLLQMAVYAVGVIFVARLGQEALAAISLAIALFGLMMWAFVGLTSAVAPLIAAELGRASHMLREVRHTMRMALWLAALCGLIGAVVCSFGEEIMLAMGQNAHIAERAGSYLAILKWGIAPMVGCNVLRIFVAALGRPVFATLITALAIIVNVIANYLLVFGHLGLPALGMGGSALASVITGWATFFAYLAAIRADRRMRRYHLLGRWWVAQWRHFADLIRIGAPISLTVLAEGGLFSSAAFLMGLMGEAELAGHTVALQIASFAFQVPLGIGQAATIRVGYHYGAANPQGITHAGIAALMTAICFMAIPASIMLLFPHFLLGIYVDTASPANIAMMRFAVQFLSIAAAFQLFDGIQTVAAGLLRGLQDTRTPMLIAIACYWLVGFTIAVTLGFATPLKGLGVWAGLASGLVIVSALLMWRWHKRVDLRLIPAAPRPNE